ncbi:hypothetical protein AVEN_167903-1 [Araneus ventricosus]|uniref:Uncharacterized protein n=1 Tax=Araneus ventricosus TaxID=182803 RepID=A0A4Y2S909_ARAVE|nr:hypothetical protein AVEN_167903-1 [Araneus ventricosus]
MKTHVRKDLFVDNSDIHLRYAHRYVETIAAIHHNDIPDEQARTTVMVPFPDIIGNKSCSHLSPFQLTSKTHPAPANPTGFKAHQLTSRFVRDTETTPVVKRTSTYY